MSDEELLRFGKAANFMCSPQANLHRPPREAFVIQLREARQEWRRRKADLMARTMHHSNSIELLYRFNGGTLPAQVCFSP
jgi:hypothetical protein